MEAILYLASRSPRRRTLLDQVGVGFQVIDTCVDETWDGQESVRDYVSRLALAKAHAGWAKVKQTDPLAVLGADTSVVIDDRILGKPSHPEQALAMLKDLSGRCHQVYTAVALVNPREHLAVNISRVHFRPLDETQLHDYVASGEAFGKAGGYAIQGRAAAFISRIEGSYSGIMGLPLYETVELLKNLPVGETAG